MNRKTVKKIISAILTLAIIITMVGGYKFNDVEATGAMKTLKASQYSKMIQGGLTKDETCLLLALQTPDRASRSQKVMTQRIKSGTEIMLFHMFRTRLNPKYKNGKYIYKIDDVNKLVSSYTKFKFQKNKKYAKWLYSDNKNLYLLAGGEGFDSYIKIVTAQYNSNKIVIKYKLYHYLDEVAYGYPKSTGTYNATFVKLNNGKYRLYSIQYIKPKK